MSKLFVARLSRLPANRLSNTCKPCSATFQISVISKSNKVVTRSWRSYAAPPQDNQRVVLRRNLRRASCSEAERKTCFVLGDSSFPPPGTLFGSLLFWRNTRADVPIVVKRRSYTFSLHCSPRPCQFHLGGDLPRPSARHCHTSQ